MYDGSRWPRRSSLTRGTHLRARAERQENSCQSSGSWHSRSTTTSRTSGLATIPTWLLGTATFSAAGKAAASTVQPRQGTMPSVLEYTAVHGTGTGPRSSSTIGLARSEIPCLRRDRSNIPVARVFSPSARHGEPRQTIWRTSPG